ncbi:tRNA/rRNA methyltransferase [Simiduia agarivorans]|uniref:RNA methyltransferase n=1 Tax=Simiduia agarivorans (strain DSM 21679 / JCM 13881 / BCRC 17597 / SA1) TaxID=1117647 RepID=K4KJN4_SIMAS|nr:tRNA/rRNA methyltransferase [Simiduia agarivorans]AFU99364.1 RNA methyltransferase [Simiduia agarivorans SA1 = DSM 21679]
MLDIVFILVAPAVPENIGASCRALKTMGFGRLRLVATEAHQHKQARILAHGSGEVLEAAEVFPDLASALADVDLSIATSAKSRHQWRSLTPADELADLIAHKGDTVARAAIVFGCEESGLSNEQLALCQLISCIPLPVTYPSLNLSQAVMLYAYELRSLAANAASPSAPVVEDGRQSQYLSLRHKTQELLEQQGYGPESKLARWALELLPQADAKAIGFLHALCDKFTKR